MSVTRRGEPDARTSLGRPIIFVCATNAWDGGGEPGEARLFESVGDTTLGQIVRGHLDQNLVARQHADAVLAHATGGVGDDLMFVFELDPERGVRKQLRHDTGKFQEFFLCHPLPSVVGNRTGGSRRPKGAKTSGITAIRQLPSTNLLTRCPYGEERIVP